MRFVVARYEKDADGSAPTGKRKGRVPPVNRAAPGLRVTALEDQRTST
ncbi:hypothetical protein SAMN05446589_4746 [Streptomyces sp. OV198]|nr:hypothetical protein SAMN05446589_4746 [Streptomyces sp. OV198]